MNENSANVTAGGTSNGLNSIFVSCTCSTEKSDNAIGLTESITSYIIVPAHDSLDMGDAITISAWLHPISCNSGYAAYPMNTHRDKEDSFFRMYFSGETSDWDKQIRSYINVGGNGKPIPPVYRFEKLNKLYQVVWTFSSKNGGNLYISGISQGDQVSSGARALTINGGSLGLDNFF